MRTGDWSSLGTDGSHIEIVPHRSEWAEIFVRVKEAILGACSPAVTRVEHVGSTSVPGLAAKPLLDVMPGILQAEDGEKTVAAMEALGYLYRGEYGIPGRFYFVLFHRGRCVVHAHMFPIGHPDWERLLLFRDYLRTHSEAAGEYARLKRGLAERFRNDREAYTESKGGFIGEIEALARARVPYPGSSTRT